jgi:Protein of unknown function (DUF3604)
MKKLILLAAVSMFSLAACQDIGSSSSGNDDSEVAITEIPEQVYWGDLHVHSNLSFDSNSFGNQNLGPDEAYRFARGEAVEASSGQKAQLSRPLDFLMVADHAEYLGYLNALQASDPVALATSLGKRWHGYLGKGEGMGPIMDEYIDMISGQRPQEVPEKSFTGSVWQKTVDIAERYNTPGKFTAFAGYEWSAMPGGRNLHRVVVFKDGPDKTKQIIPYSALESNDPEDLWKFLDGYEQKTGGSVLAIAHNGNLSGGIMFDDKTLSGEALTADYAKRRSRWEPAYEVTQVKGDGEAHPLLSPDDEFADFETWDEYDISRVAKPKDPAKRKAMLEAEYSRSGLKKGLAYAANLGANPFQFGLIGSTDTHTALSTADDNNFWGKFKDSEPSAERVDGKMGGALWPNWQLTASGYTGVWARANTRAELFAAIKRREVYATTGPRIKIRLFAGWVFEKSDLTRSDFAKWGYAKGVPMGGLLSSVTKESAPRFMVKATKDSEGGNLERAQIIKGWRDRNGTLHEKIYAVDLASAPTGEAELTAYWRDPDFDKAEHAFYYLRVLEIPTKRWTSYDAEKYGVTLPTATPKMTQERAYSSPIWYKPS